jgi:hypothetical protein
MNGANLNETAIIHDKGFRAGISYSIEVMYVIIPDNISVTVAWT